MGKPKSVFHSSILACLWTVIFCWGSHSFGTCIYDDVYHYSASNRMSPKGKYEENLAINGGYDLPKLRENVENLRKRVCDAIKSEDIQKLKSEIETAPDSDTVAKKILMIRQGAACGYWAAQDKERTKELVDKQTERFHNPCMRYWRTQYYCAIELKESSAENENLPASCPKLAPYEESLGSGGAPPTGTGAK